MLVACFKSTSLISLKASISLPSAISAKVCVDGSSWVDGRGATPSPSLRSHWLILLGGIVGVIFRAKNTMSTKCWDLKAKGY
jgi:hypothetical protein